MKEEGTPEETPQPEQLEEIQIPELQPEYRQSKYFELGDTDPNAPKMPALCGNSAHPILAMVYVLMKSGLVFLYLFLPIVVPSLFNFVAIMISLGAVDFYFTKNIVGRRLVGMRWWLEIS
jgi:hypothetical protein